MRAGFWLDLLAVAWTVREPSLSDNSTNPVPFPSQIFPNATYPGAVDPAAIAGSQFGEKSAPFYPSPWANGQGDWAEAYQKAIQFVQQLTLLEKVNITTGVG